MTKLITGPFAPVPQSIESGRPCYLLGKAVPGARFRITSIAVATNVATLGVVLMEGNIPAAGTLAYSQGLAQGVVSDVAISAPTIAGNGVGTLTVPLTHANLSTTPTSGMLIIPEADAGELVSGTYQSAAAALASMPGFPSNSRDVTVTVLHPSAPASFSLQVVGALSLNDPWENVGAAITADGSVTILGFRYNLISVIDTITGGTAPSAVVKVLA